MPKLYLMPSGKIAVQANKPVLLTDQQFFDCCCWDCASTATVQICCANGVYTRFAGRHTLDLVTSAGTPYFYEKLESSTAGGVLNQWVWVLYPTASGWVVILRNSIINNVAQTRGGEYPFDRAYVSLRASSGYSGACPPSGTYAVLACGDGATHGALSQCSCSINANIIAYVDIAQQTCSCPASVLSISPSTRTIDQGTSNSWTFAVSNPKQLEIFFSVDWGDGTSSTATATGCSHMVYISKTYDYPGVYTITGTAKTSSTGSTIDTQTASVEVNRAFNFDECNKWFNANSGGQGGTSDTWTIPVDIVPAGTPMDIRFDAYGIPDKFIVNYNGAEVYNSGWRGNSSYEGNPLYPGGIEGPGDGEALGIFNTVEGVNTFTVTVEAPQQGTAWNYDIRADCP